MADFNKIVKTPLQSLIEDGTIASVRIENESFFNSLMVLAPDGKWARIKLSSKAIERFQMEGILTDKLISEANIMILDGGELRIYFNSYTDLSVIFEPENSIARQNRGRIVGALNEKWSGTITL